MAGKLMMEDPIDTAMFLGVLSRSDLVWVLS